MYSLIITLVMVLLLPLLCSSFEGEAAELTSTRLLGDLQIGDRVVDKSWEWEHRTGSNYTGSGETKPVTWIVVAKNHYVRFSQGEGRVAGDKNHVTLISEELIGSYLFDNSSNRWYFEGRRHGSNVWRDSGAPNATRGIRKFLNGSSYQGDDVNDYRITFYDSMSEGFRDAILETNLYTDGYYTDDKIFLPTTRELGSSGWMFFLDDCSRIAKLEGMPRVYYTRRPAGQPHLWKVSTAGKFVRDTIIWGSGISYGAVRSHGIRPALNMSSEILVSAVPNEDGVYEVIDWQDQFTLQSRRLSGENRFLTAIEISKDSYPQSQSADAVVLARGDDFADALPGGVLAYQKNGPLLLTQSDILPTAVRNEITRVLRNGGTIYLLGGNIAISQEVENELKGLGDYKVTRISGMDRKETALKIAQELESSSGKAVIAFSRNFPDALAISSYAAREGIPILLTRTENLSGHAAEYFTSNNITQVYAAGGTSVISDQVVNQIENIAGKGSVKRLGGADRYQTAKLIAEEFFPEPQAVSIVYGGNFPDALAGGVNAAMYHAPVLLVETDKIPSTIAEYLSDKKGYPRSVIIYGGDTVVSDTVMNEAVSLIQ